jgi:diacylglycerol kinase
MMNDDLPSPERSWASKFRDAFRGLKSGIRGQSTFFVHFFVAAIVVAAAAMLGMDLYEWSLLLLCIAGVLTAEMFNSSIESMAKAVTCRNDPHVGASLDIAAAAVLVASLGASLVGAIVFARRLGAILDWW